MFQALLKISVELKKYFKTVIKVSALIANIFYFAFCLKLRCNAVSHGLYWECMAIDKDACSMALSFTVFLSIHELSLP